MMLSGHIVGAAVTSITLLGQVNLTALREFGSAGSRGDVIDRCWCWESYILKISVYYNCQVHLQLRGGDDRGCHGPGESGSRGGDLRQHRQDAVRDAGGSGLQGEEKQIDRWDFYKRVTTTF